MCAPSHCLTSGARKFQIRVWHGSPNLVHGMSCKTMNARMEFGSKKNIIYKLKIFGFWKIIIFFNLCIENCEEYLLLSTRLISFRSHGRGGEIRGDLFTIEGKRHPNFALHCTSKEKGRNY